MKKKTDVGHVDGKGYTASGLYFTDDEIAEIRRRFSLDEGFPLHQQLEDIALWYFADRDIPASPAGARRKKLIRKAKRASSQLRECLEELSYFDLGLLNAATGVDSSERKRSMLRLEVALRSILENESVPEPRGRPPKDHRRYLVKKLADLFQAAGGPVPGYTQDPGDSTYHGKFIEFIELVCDYAGIDEKNRNLGDAFKQLKAEK